jgi:hypothetical protein
MREQQVTGAIRWSLMGLLLCSLVFFCGRVLKGFSFEEFDDDDDGRII